MHEELAFRGTWRRHQVAALAAFERTREAGGRRTHVVAPPGSGKTLLGVELVRRSARRALVLAPGPAVQLQWPRAVRSFGAPAGTVGPEPGVPIACLTYAGLCGVADPAALLEREEPLAALPSAARARLARLRAGGIGIVVLDECHHLASPWGRLVAAVLAELGREEEPHVVGLTTTPPDDLRDDEGAYAALLGPPDLVVPAAALVRDGHLAPYHGLAWLTEPTEAERARLADHEAPLRELAEDLTADPAFRAWIAGVADSGLAAAAARVGRAAGMPGPVPPRAPAGSAADEAFRRPPDLEDWVVLLEAYALRRLRPDREAAGRYGEVAAALGRTGFRLTDDGVRRGAGEEDRLLTGSRAKAGGMVEVLAAEREARGEALRGVVVCDAEAAGAAPPRLAGAFDPAAATARHALLAVAGDARTAPLRPLLVSDRGLRCLPGDEEALLPALEAAAAEHLALPEWAAEPDGVLVSLRSSGAEWVPRAWAELAARVLEDGAAGVLVATAAVLGEGWACPAVNVLVDLTTARAPVSGHQVHGLPLRLDPRQPGKVASIWDVVCVAPELLRGRADHAGFARRHRHLHAPALDGELEAGAGHAHPALAASVPPAAAPGLNATALARAGTPWRPAERSPGAEVSTLVVRHEHWDADQPPTDPAGRAGRARRRVDAFLPLAAAARAVAAAYRELGELSEAAEASLRVQPYGEGRRCLLPAATPAESARFAAALDELLTGAHAPRLLVSRPLPDPVAGPGTRLGRVLARRGRLPTRSHPVPTDLSRTDERAEAFARAWRRHVGPTGLTPAGEGPAPGDGGYETAVRAVWA